VNGLGLAQTLVDQVEVPLRGSNSLRGFLLEGMEHVQNTLKTHRVDCTVGVTVEVIAYLKNSAAKASQGLCVSDGRRVAP
jgi:hypothetical protein